MYTRLRELREDNDLTQEKCAKIAFISKNSYIRYETGERTPPLDVIITYAKYYNVSLDYIAGLTNDPRGIGFDKSAKYNIVQSGNRKAIINIGDDKP